MPTTAPLARVLADIAYVRRFAPDLWGAKAPGTRRRWAQTESRADSRRRRTVQDAGVPLAGLTRAPAPLDLAALDAAAEVLAIARELAHAVSILAGLGPVPDSRDPRPYLDRAAEHLAPVAGLDGGWLLEAALDPDDACSITRARRLTTHVLGLGDGGQAIDADCPWCGARPLRLRIAAAGEPLIVCEARRVCEPPESDVGTWHRGRPAWIEPEWDWLARRIAHAADVAQSTLAG